MTRTHAARHSARAPRPVLAAACLGSAVLLFAPAATPAGAQSPAASVGPVPGTTITLQTHDSFALSEGMLERFTEQTGVTVQVLTGGDAGSMVNQAILSRDHPLGDVLFGVDNTFLSRALDAGIFLPYRPAALADVPDALELDPEGRVTPIDYGDVCVNMDLEALGGADQPPLPTTLDDLADPALKDRLVVEDPGTSSPGLAFLLATIARYSDDGQTTWRDYWTSLRANGVLVSPDWSDAYYSRFSGGVNEGDRPLVVSYASSPVAEVVYGDPRPETPPTGVLLDGCFRQIEFAGVLAGTPHEAEARAFIDFLLSPEVQADIPLSMFVSPANATAPIPADYAAFNAVPAEPLTLDPATIAANRERWIEEWTQLVLR